MSIMLFYQKLEIFFFEIQVDPIRKQLSKCVYIYIQDVDSRISVCLDMKWSVEDLWKVRIRPKKNLSLVRNGCAVSRH